MYMYIKVSVHIKFRHCLYVQNIWEEVIHGVKNPHNKPWFYGLLLKKKYVMVALSVFRTEKLYIHLPLKSAKSKQIKCQFFSYKIQQLNDN